MSSTGVGARIRELRIRQGLSQEALASRAGISTFSVSRIETGSRRPGEMTIAKVARALGVEPGELFREPALPLGEAPQESGHAADVGEKVVMVDLGEFRAKLRGEGLDEALTDFVVAIAENAVVGQNIYGDAYAREANQIRIVVTDNAAATDQVTPLIHIGEFKEILVEAGLDQESAEWTAERVFAMVEARRDG